MLLQSAMSAKVQSACEVLYRRQWLQHCPDAVQLVLEVVQQLQRMFQPDIKQIKKRIEDLIQREFLVRMLHVANGICSCSLLTLSACQRRPGGYPICDADMSEVFASPLLTERIPTVCQSCPGLSYLRFLTHLALCRSATQTSQTHSSTWHRRS